MGEAWGSVCECVCLCNVAIISCAFLTCFVPFALLILMQVGYMHNNEGKNKFHLLFSVALFSICVFNLERRIKRI